ncbi:glyoxalase family protein [Saccharopolyspora lacisalsi]|uniref:Glyoxalase family protein n=1 Tax=Halosaccharopolyspora lacisalsi TaxID=1000566 RepID=A0A839DZ56_9PSEU|nr:ring-cleaving dioxygenase [Halosaccharopolyspora lacisalsi]MBA8824675.1 glyoxalase family protein [Halosaccharopolyspora lacisalsi]
MPSAPAGLHHVTAIATDPQRNADFYHAVLGLRLVKTTVNFDAPDTYHLYFGDESGQPGTLITFFPWPSAPRGRRGAGQTTTVAFSVPQGSLGWWQHHLRELATHVGAPATRGDEETLTVYDPDGLALELVTQPESDPRPPWNQGPIPPEHAIRGLHSVTLTEVSHEHTAELFTDTLGFRLLHESSARFRFTTGHGGSGAMVDLLCSPEAPQGLVAAGTVHHIAWRTPDETQQTSWRTTLVDRGLNVTPILDRRYFQSIYFREPGGVLLEIATDSPGFTVDEPLMELGRALKLPPWLEPTRAEIERELPTLRVPGPDEDVTVADTTRQRG